MTNQEIFELMARFDQSGITTFKLNTKDFTLELGKGGSAAVPAAPVGAPAPAAAAPAPAAQPDGPCITAPLVGTFYAASAPDAEPFVKVGDKVKRGQTLCIVEAMKLMNEIMAEVDGEIVEICVANGQVVDYGSPLFRIRER